MDTLTHVTDVIVFIVNLNQVPAVTVFPDTKPGEAFVLFVSAAKFGVLAPATKTNALGGHDPLNGGVFLYTSTLQVPETGPTTSQPVIVQPYGTLT